MLQNKKIYLKKKRFKRDEIPQRNVKYSFKLVMKIKSYFRY